LKVTILSPIYARLFINGGGKGIRTPARFDPPVGFQDRSLQPDLGIPPYWTKNNIAHTEINVKSILGEKISPRMLLIIFV
jgi:hypothetical protein